MPDLNILSLYREFERISLENPADVKESVIDFIISYPRDAVEKVYELGFEVLEGLCDVRTGIDVKKISRLSYAVVILGVNLYPIGPESSTIPRQLM